MHEMIRDIENREVGPCGGFTTMYACMCDYYSLPYREEVAWVSMCVNSFKEEICELKQYLTARQL